MDQNRSRCLWLCSCLACALLAMGMIGLAFYLGELSRCSAAISTWPQSPNASVTTGLALGTAHQETVLAPSLLAPSRGSPPPGLAPVPGVGSRTSVAVASGTPTSAPVLLAPAGGGSDSNRESIEHEYHALVQRFHGGCSLLLPPPEVQDSGVGLSKTEKLRLLGVQTYLRKKLNQLVAYYECDRDLLEKASFKALRNDAPFVAKLADRLVRRDDFVGKQGPHFVIAAIGSSVTAGHGTFRAVAYPAVMEDRLKPVWAAAGIALEVRNRGTGAEPVHPMSFCLPQRVGLDADVVVVENEFWPYTQGLSINGLGSFAKEGAAKDAAGMEIVMRMALNLPRQPALHFMSLTKVDFSFMNDWLSQSGPLKPYGRYAINGFTAFRGAFEHFKTSRHCTGKVLGCLKAEGKQDGYHTDSVSMRAVRQRAALMRTLPNHGDDPQSITKHGGTLFVNWHPGPLGHEVIGNQMAYYHMKAMDHAISLLLASDEQGLQELRGNAAAQPLPQNAQCSDVVCSPLFPPTCAYSTLPSSTPNGIMDRVVDERVAAKNGWTMKECPGNRGRCEKSGRGRRLVERDYLDCRLTAQGFGTGAPLSLRFTAMYRCMIVIGECTSYGWNRPRDIVDWSTDVAVNVEGEPCLPPNCIFYGAGSNGVHTVVVDARALLGSKCREKVDVDIMAKPGNPLAHSCSKDHKNRCVGLSCNLQPLADGSCKATPRYQQASRMKMYVSFAISF